MGRAKQTLSFGTSTITGSVTRTLLDAGLTGVVVVTRTELVGCLDLPGDSRVSVAINDNLESEMIDSIRIGLATLVEQVGIGAPPDSVGVLVVPGDMPALCVESCRACAAGFTEDPTRIVIATHKGRRGHPIVFPLNLRSSVDEVTGGLRSLAEVHAERVCHVEIDDPGATRDIDTPEDYERA